MTLEAFIKVYDSTPSCGTEGRSVRVWYDTIPHPQPRQNRNSRWGNSPTALIAKRYNNWRGAFRDALLLSMAKNRVEQFGEVPLKLTVKFTVKGRHGDLSNYIKALEDVLNGILWVDDKWVHQIEAEMTVGKPEINFQVREL